MARSEKGLLLELLNQWSLKHNLAEDPYLNSMIRTIKSDGPLDVWSKLDPEIYLPRPLSKVGAPFIRASRYLAIIRNVTVFVPVALTWKAVSEATRAFSQFVDSQNVAPVNFLEFWQNGYGVLDEKWRISTIAELDFLIIIFIIIATLLSTILLNFGRTRDAAVQKLNDQEREVVIFEIKSFLYLPDVGSKEAIDDSLRAAIRNLSHAAQSISDAAAKLEKSMAKQSKSIAESQVVAREVKSFQSKILRILKKNEA